MDAQLKAKWVEALRSGKYAQGRISLLRDNKYCCLGVLADVAGWPLGSADDADQAYRNFPLAAGDLYSLERMNDSEGKSFAEIADYIEANL